MRMSYEPIGAVLSKIQTRELICPHLDLLFAAEIIFMLMPRNYFIKHEMQIKSNLLT